MKKQSNPELVDEENPEWTESDFNRAQPASEILPKLLDKAVASELLRPRGRPKAAITKQRITIRLSQDVLDHFKASGDGWQTRIDDALKDWLKNRIPA